MINFSELFWKLESKGDRRSKTSRVAFDNIGVSAELAQIPVDYATLAEESKAALLIDQRGAAADRFRYLRMRLREIREVTKLRCVAITSPLPEEGKSSTALCLATALSEGGTHRTLLLEADLHRPSLSKGLGLQSRPGIAEIIEEGLDPLSQIRKVEPMGLYLLQSGQPRGNPTEFLQSDAFAALIQNLTAHFDWILIDTPPVLPLTDALSLARHADAVLLVARANRTPRKAIEESLKLIGRKYILGILLNGAEGFDGLYSKYYSYYPQR